MLHLLVFDADQVHTMLQDDLFLIRCVLLYLSAVQEQIVLLMEQIGPLLP